MKLKELRLLFTTPIYQNNYLNNPLFGVDEEVAFKNSMQQVSIAKECANWIKEKVQIKEAKTKGIIPFNPYHIDNTKNSTALKSSAFCSTKSNILPGVATSISTPFFSFAFCGFIPTPITVLCRTQTDYLKSMSSSNGT